MIKTLIAQISELDNPEQAVSEILDQLDIERNLHKNSVGLMACYQDFIENGIVKAICERLPFDVAGINTLNSATSKGEGPLTLSLTVLTSDDVFFSVGLSAPLTHNHEDSLRELYERTSAKHRDKPSLILAFAPASQHSTAGDYMVDALDTASGGVPIFGMMPSDFTTFLRKPLVIFNGQAYEDSMAVVLISGQVNPRFTCMAIPEEKTLKRKAVITSSQGNILKEINGSPAIDYLKSIGLVKDKRLVSTLTIFLVIYHDDGTEPVVRTILALTPEGYPILGGLAPEGCTIGIGTLDPSDVLNMASQTTESLGKYDFVFIASCITRNFILEWNSMAEIKLFQSGLGENAPFLFAYAAGEICPVRGIDDKLVNRFHNLTLVSCAL